MRKWWLALGVLAMAASTITGVMAVREDGTAAVLAGGAVILACCSVSFVFVGLAWITDADRDAAAEAERRAEWFGTEGR